METKNWIEIIKESVYVAMNEKLEICTFNNNNIYIYYKCGGELTFRISRDLITISTPKGYININYSLTDREKLEIDSLMLSIKEYNEDMAISEVEDFVSSIKVDHEIKDINDLDD